MGLTIHYKLSLDGDYTKGEVAQKVLDFRESLMDLPFEEVGIVLGTTGRNVAKIDLRRDYDRCLSYSFYKYVQIETKDGIFIVKVDPTCTFGFHTYPGKGCEWASFGLRKLPKTVYFSEAIYPYDGKFKPAKRFPVEDGGKWSWSSFCKTQYASKKGIDNFIRCHTLVISALDIAKSMGFSVEVHDEGDYWDNRDIKKLSQEVVSWNEFIASLAGNIKDFFVGEKAQISAPILSYPDFEILEARGKSKLDSLAVDKHKSLEIIRDIADKENNNNV